MTHKHLIRAVAGAGLLVVALSGCSTMKGWFAGRSPSRAVVVMHSVS